MQIHCDYSFWESTFFSLLHLSEKKVRVATAFSNSDVTGKANELVFVLRGRVYQCRKNENKHNINFISVCLSCGDAAV